MGIDRGQVYRGWVPIDFAEMGNMEGCLRAAGLAAAEEAKRGDILPPIGSSTNQTNQSSALGGSEEEVLPEELPLPVALEDALAESATDESVTEPKLTTESEPTEPESTEPEPTEPEHPEPEAGPTNSEPVSVEEIAVVEESDANVEPSIDGFLDDRASQNIIEQANAEFDKLDTNGDGTLSPEEFAASSALAGAELVTEVADSDEESAADAEVPEYRREWTERLQAAESEAAAEQAGDAEEASIGQANEAMHAWQEGDEAGMSAEPQPEPEVAVADGEEPVDGLHKFLDAVKAGFGSQYTSALKEGGFETGRALSLASAKDLQQCGVALGHALLIVDTVQKVAKYC